MTRSFAAVVLLAVSVLVGGCDSDRRAISRDDLPDVPAEATVVVEVGDDGFDVRSIDVSTDDLVEFRNVGDREHGVRSDDYEINSGALLPGEFTLVIFDQPGSYTMLDTADEDETMTVVSTEPVSP